MTSFAATKDPSFGFRYESWYASTCTFSRRLPLLHYYHHYYQYQEAEQCSEGTDDNDDQVTYEWQHWLYVLAGRILRVLEVGSSSSSSSCPLEKWGKFLLLKNHSSGRTVKRSEWEGAVKLKAAAEEWRMLAEAHEERRGKEKMWKYTKEGQRVNRRKVYDIKAITREYFVVTE